MDRESHHHSVLLENDSFTGFRGWVATLLTFVFLVVNADSALTADRHQQGLVFGAGIGFSPIADFDDDMSTTVVNYGPRTRHETSAAFAFDVRVGYAFDSRNTIVAEIHSSLYDTDRLPGATWQFFFGPVWYHYYATRGRSIFTAAGVGGYSVYAYESKPFAPGIGVLAGAGVELGSRLQGAFYFAKGSADGQDYTGFVYHDINLYSVSFVISYVILAPRD